MTSKLAKKLSRPTFSVRLSLPFLHHIVSYRPFASGLIALIESDPYDLSPSQVPILRALVKHAHSPPPISKIVGDALTTFWRNHREHWHTEVRSSHIAFHNLLAIYAVLPSTEALDIRLRF
jgi:hypothetical protein